jgi:hypothetical protein
MFDSSESESGGGKDKIDELDELDDLVARLDEAFD